MIALSRDVERLLGVRFGDRVQLVGLGFTPMAMFWRPETPSAQKWARGDEWRAFQRRWARPTIIHARPGPGARGDAVEPMLWT